MRYHIVYADPPWKYNARKNTSTKFGGGAMGHYPCMTLKEIKNRVQQRIEAEIASLELSLKIAKDINLEKSLVQKMMDKSVNTFLMTPPSEKFYKGSIILEYKINNYQELLNKLFKKDFDYDPILNQSVVTNTFAENYKIFPYVGFAIGLLFSLFVVYIRYISSLR